MFLDPATRTFVEETGGANFFFVTEDGELVIPKSDSILPSITRRSVITVAGMLGIKVTERPVNWKEIGKFDRKRTVRNCSSHLSSRQDHRSWKRDRIQGLRTYHGTCYKAAL